MPRCPRLLTCILWHHLFHPPPHPLFWKTLATPADSPTTRLITGIVPLVGPLACCGIWALLIPLELPIPMLLLVAMVTLSSSYVVVWVLRATAAIAGARERGTYDQLCLPPSGALGANWALCAAALHRHDALAWIDLIRKLLAGLLLFILLMVLMTTALRENVFDPLQFLRLLLDMIALAAASYIDHVQSIVLGSLVGMLAPVYSPTRVHARLLAVMVFLTLQTLTCLAMLFVVLVIVPSLYSTLRAASWYAEISPTLLSLLVFYLTREGFIIVLWRALTYHWNTNPAEFDAWT